MLILQRSKREGVKIGDVIVMINQIRRGRVSLAIDAPADTKITRIADERERSCASVRDKREDD